MLCLNARAMLCCVRRGAGDQLIACRHLPFNTQAGGFVVWGRVNANLNISRALGDASFKQVGGRAEYVEML